MVSERTAYGSLLLVMIVGMGFILFGMYASAGQSLNTATMLGGVILLVGLSMMLYVTVSAFEMQEEPTYGQD